MNLNSKLLRAFPVIITLSFIITLNIACQQDPLSSADKNQTVQTVASDALQILTYSDNSITLKKTVTVSKWITWEEGGELKLKCQGSSPVTSLAVSSKIPQVSVALKVLQHTISQDAELSLSMDDAQLSGNFDMLFAPHGITFSSPAMLNIEAKHLNLDGIDPDDVNIYYDNEETGEWEVMNCEEIIVKPQEGYIKIVDAELPHFSRYAIGME